MAGFVIKRAVTRSILFLLLRDLPAEIGSCDLPEAELTARTSSLQRRPGAADVMVSLSENR